MAATISWDNLRQLAAFRAVKGCAVSLYLDLDPSNAPTAGDVQTRARSLLDGAGKSDGARRGESTHDQRQALREDFERIRRYFEDEFDRDGVQGLALFTSALDNLWRPLPLVGSVADEVHVGRELYLTPLVPLVGRGEGALVAMVSREQGRLYQLRGGRLEDLADRFDEQPGQHDQGGWSQARFRRHIEKLVEEHLKAVAEELAQHVRRLRSARVVVVCAEEMRSGFEAMLPKEVRAAIVGWAQAEAHATPAELLEVASPPLEAAREREETGAVERWREEAGRNGRAASGWEETLEAASDGRVDVLLFTEGVSHDAWQCPACGRVGASGGRCPLDGTEMEERSDGLDLAVHQTLVHGGSVWALRHRGDLDPVEGVGAVLRY
ncbi:MAG: Vms1/Ankzf1 family peptidyl-tRNA hydrolase [Gaiellaceae bacterium]